MKNQFMTKESRASEGYHIIRNMFSEAKSVKEITQAAQRSIQIIAEYNIDDYQEKKLEQYGFECYERIMNDLRRIEQERSSNRGINFKNHK